MIQYLEFLKKYWPLCTAIFVAVIFLGVVFILQSPRIYKVSTHIKPKLDLPCARFFAEKQHYQVLNDVFNQINKGKSSRINLILDMRDQSVIAEVYGENPQEITNLLQETNKQYLQHQTGEQKKRIQNEEEQALNNLTILNQKYLDSTREYEAFFEQNQLSKEASSSQPADFTKSADSRQLADYSNQLIDLRHQIKTLNNANKEIEKEKVNLQYEIAEIEKELQQMKTPASFIDTIRFPALSQMKMKWMELKTNLFVSLERYKPEH